ncbi:MAG: hypothetical protein QW403_03415 [Candidatus Aenigmatarchaeota archaeon]
MIVVQFSFNVPEEKIQEFLEHSRSTLKRTWESRRRKSYTAYRSLTERIRNEQIIRK